MGGEGEGSGVKGGGKWGFGTPLSTPSVNIHCAYGGPSWLSEQIRLQLF